MVPYVRKSFFKHYSTVVDIIPFIKGEWLSSVTKDNSKDISIDSCVYKGKHWFNLIKRYVWKKAYKLTVKELNQAVEGMYHNLNTLQSRSGNQLASSCVAA
jgi:ribonucleoside-triphosphate reductase